MTAGHLVLATGVVLFAIAVLGSLTGLWKALLYDADAGSGKVTAVGGPLSYNAVIDANAKHIRDNVGASDEPDSYLGHLAKMNTLADGIGPVAASTAQMTENVHALRAGLGNVLTSSQAIDAGLLGVAAAAAKASRRLSGVASSSTSIAEMMGLLNGATASLGGSVNAINGTAGGISTDQLPSALAATRKLDSLLPKGIPPAVKEP